MASKNESVEMKAFEAAMAGALTQVKKLSNISDARRAFSSAINLQEHIMDQLVHCSQKDSTGTNSRTTDVKVPPSDGKALLQINFHSPSAGGVNKRKPKLPARLSDASSSKSSARSHTANESANVSQTSLKRGLLSPDSGISPSNSSSPSPNGDLLADSKTSNESTPKRFKEASALLNDSLSSVSSTATPDASGAPHATLNPSLSALAQLTASLSAAISNGAANGGLPNLLPLLNALPAPLNLQALIQNLQNNTLALNAAVTSSSAASGSFAAASPIAAVSRLPAKLEPVKLEDGGGDSEGSSAPENESSTATQPLHLADIKPQLPSAASESSADLNATPTDALIGGGSEHDEAPASPPPLAGQSASAEKAIVNQLIRESERVVNGCRVYECRYCGKVYDIAASMRYHMRIIHLRAHLQHARTQCKRCGKHFTSVSAVNRHERICGTLGFPVASSNSGAPTQAPTVSPTMSPALPDATAAASSSSAATSGSDALNGHESNEFAKPADAVPISISGSLPSTLSLPTLTPLSSLAAGLPSLLSSGLNNTDSPLHAILKQVVQQSLASAASARASALEAAAAAAASTSAAAAGDAPTEGSAAEAANGSDAGSDEEDDGSENKALTICDGAGAGAALTPASN